MVLDRHFLVRLLGFRGALLHGDPLVADRWRFLRRRLPLTRNGETLLDAGCGSGVFTLGAAKRGYSTIGLSWDERNQRTAEERAQICGVPETKFPILDLRQLDARDDLKGRFDVIVNFENIEHVLDDRKLMRDLAECLKPGGRLIMTSPNFYYRPLSSEDLGPFAKVEDGRHVRRGYTRAMFEEMAKDAGLIIDEITTCSGFVSQHLARAERALGGGALSRVLLPLRVLPWLLDGIVSQLTGYPGYSICMVAMKPRYR